MRSRLLWYLLLVVLVACGEQVPGAPAPAKATVTPMAATASLATDFTATPVMLSETEPVTPLPPPPAGVVVTPQPTITPEPFSRLDWRADGEIVLSGWRIGSGEPRLALVVGLDSGMTTAWAEQQLRPLLQARIATDFSYWLFVFPAGETGLDRSRNADTALDQCGNNDWERLDPRSGPYPFSDPGLLTLYDLLKTIPTTIFLERGPSTLVAGCQNLVVSELFADELNLPVVQASFNGYVGDLLASYGRHVVSMTQPSLDLVPILEAAFDLMPNLYMMESRAAGTLAFWFEPEDVGSLRFPGTQPLAGVQALATTEQTIFFLLNGIVFELPRTGSRIPRAVLQPGDQIDGVTVLEPLDLAATDGLLLVLDRAGDVYQRRADGSWHVEWYDRPVRDISSQYYVALAAAKQRLLLESSYQYVQSYLPGGEARLWLTPDQLAVDLDGDEDGAYLLTAESMQGQIRHYQDTALIDAFAPTMLPWRPRQLALGENVLYVLDQAGQRILLYQRTNGVLNGIMRLTWNETIVAINVDRATDELAFVTPQGIHFWQGAAQDFFVDAWVPVAPALTTTATLNQLRGLRLPIPGSPIPDRFLRLPGAPRHYRFGVHAGTDLYWAPGTAVGAVADGTIIRIDNSYAAGAQRDYDRYRTQSWELGYTSAEAAEFYRGRQVWIAHEDGLISRYAHLSTVANMLSVGSQVLAGQLIGEVGNSGSPAALQGPAEDAHLHIELWVDDQYLGQFLHPTVTYEWLQIIFRRGGS